MDEKRQNDLQEFIRLAHEITKPIIDEYIDPHTLQLRAYFQTEKGIIASKKGDALRRKRMQEAKAETSWDELQLIKQFYRNTPKGYQVDHIVPVSRGGKHTLSNLQYLTKEENAKKFNKLAEELENS